MIRTSDVLCVEIGFLTEQVVCANAKVVLALTLIMGFIISDGSPKWTFALAGRGPGRQGKTQRFRTTGDFLS